MSLAIKFLIFLSPVLFILTGKGQSKRDIKFEVNKQELKEGEELILSVILTDMANSDISNFPKIDGFRKKNKTVSHTKIKKDGKTVLRHVINQTYIARVNGEHISPKFDFVINEEKVSFPPITIKISSENDIIQTIEPSIAINEELQLFLYANTNTVKVGQGLLVNVGFYVPKSNTSEIAFSKNFNAEIQAVQKAIEPENSIINRKTIQEIEGSEITFKNKTFIKYLLYEAVFYPLQSGKVYFPSVQLTIDQKVASDTSKIISTKFRSLPYIVKVEELPEHPLKNRVQPGVFQIKKMEFPKEISTGKIYNYSITISGNGNFRTMVLPKPDNDTKFDFYPPDAKENIREGSSIGQKVFFLKIYPKDSGIVDIGKYFPFIYFNTNTNKYDTLTIEQKVKVSGEQIISSKEAGNSLYSNIENLGIGTREINIRKITKNIANIVLILMLAGTFFLFFWKKIEQ